MTILEKDSTYLMMISQLTYQIWSFSRNWEYLDDGKTSWFTSHQRRDLDALWNPFRGVENIWTLFRSIFDGFSSDLKKCGIWNLNKRLASDKMFVISWLNTVRDRIVVSTLRCDRSNSGSNPGHGVLLTLSFCFYMPSPT